MFFLANKKVVSSYTKQNIMLPSFAFSHVNTAVGSDVQLCCRRDSLFSFCIYDLLHKKMGKRVFVTVGTTQFNSLVKKVGYCEQ